MNPKLGIGLIVITAILIWVLQHDAHARGVAEGKSDFRGAVIQRITDTIKVKDTKYRRDSVFVHDTLTRYLTTHDTIVVMHHDTAVVYVEKKQADAAVQACTSLLNACDIRIALYRARSDSLAVQLANVPKPQGFFARWSERTLYFGSGFGTCSILRR